MVKIGSAEVNKQNELIGMNTGNGGQKSVRIMTRKVEKDNPALFRHSSSNAIKKGFYSTNTNGGLLHGNSMREIQDKKRILEKNNGFGENPNRGMAGLATNRLFHDALASKRRDLIQENQQYLQMDKYGRLKDPNAYNQNDDLKKLTYNNADPRIDSNMDNNRSEISETSQSNGWQKNIKKKLNWINSLGHSGEYLRMGKMPQYPNNPLAIKTNQKMLHPYQSQFNVQNLSNIPNTTSNLQCEPVIAYKKSFTPNSLDTNWAKFTRGKLGTNAYLACKKCDYVLCMQADIDVHALFWYKSNFENGNRNFMFDENDCDGG